MEDDRYMSDAVAILALLDTPGVGPVAIHEAVAGAKVIEKQLSQLLDMPARALANALPAGFQQTASLLTQCGPDRLARAERLVQAIARVGGDAIPVTDPRFPPRLNQHLGTRGPVLLFTVGNIELLDGPAAGVVGTRTPSALGRQLASQCATTFAQNGITVVSGGAQGVDTAAHMSVLAVGGQTVVALPQGLLTYRPSRELQNDLENGRVLLLSEFAPDTGWQTHAAVTRNATISALSRIVCVIEPRKAGGSIRTARLALGQGKRVLVYVADGLESVRRTLENGGAQALCDRNGHFNVQRLMDAYEIERDAANMQTEFL